MTEPAPPTDDRRKQTIIATTAVLGLLLTYMIFRRSAHVAAGSPAAVPSTVNNPNSDGVQQLLTGILGAQQTVSGQLGQLVSNSTHSTTTVTPSTPTRSTAIFHFSDLHGKAPTLRDIAQMVYGIATPGNINVLQKNNPQFQYAGGKSGSDTRITNVNRNSGIIAPIPQLPLATLQHIPLSPVELHTQPIPARTS